MAVVARFLAKEQDAPLLDVRDADCRKIRDVDEVWVHSCWMPEVWRACHIASKENKSLVRMMHGNLDPVRLRYHGWKKQLVGFIERFFLRQADTVVATCEAEAEWIRKYEPRVKKIEVTDIKRFFKLGSGGVESGGVESGGVESGGVSFNNSQLITHNSQLHLLYLGRRHPLKGVEYLEKAVAELNSNPVNPVQNSSTRLSKENSSLHVSTRSTRLKTELRIVSSAFGEEKEKVWNWCDVLVLPTLSENFGLVVAEALERGKRVITTDGAPAWGSECKMESVKCKVGDGEVWSGYDGRLLYLKGYRDGTREGRIELLKRAMESLVR